MNDVFSVWVTGLGCVSAAGADASATMRGVEKTIRPQTRPVFWEEDRSGFSCPPGLVCPVRDAPGQPLSVSDMQKPASWRSSTIKDCTFLLRQALEEALRSAGLADIPDASGICIGTTAGCSLHFLQDYSAARKRRASADAAFPPGGYAAAEAFFDTSLALDLAERAGPALTVSNACTSGADAIGMAAQWIRAGVCDIALAGGVDTLNILTYIGFNKLMVYSPEPCKPFALNRKGLNLGEGAAVLILENETRARQRGVQPRAVLSGFGAASDAYHLTAPHPQGRGLRAAIAAALAQAGLRTTDISFINAHGTATIENDNIESRIYNEIFADTPVWASKGSTGHCLGASGAIEAVLTILALSAGVVPSSVAERDYGEVLLPRLTLSPVPAGTGYAMSVSAGFGGGNAALVFSRAI